MDDIACCSNNFYYNLNRSFAQEAIKMTQVKKFSNGFKKGMQDFASNLTIIINFILLSLVYIIGVGITSIIAKTSNKRFLETKYKKGSL